jgi:GT2 family glycosyltransferase
MQEQDVDFIHGSAMEIVQRSGKKFYIKPKVEFPTFDSLLKKNTIHGVSLMYKREIFEKLGGFDETLNASEEYEFNLRCLKAGYKIGYCPSVLAIYRRHQGQKVASLPARIKEVERKLIKDRYRA